MVARRVEVEVAVIFREGMTIGKSLVFLDWQQAADRRQPATSHKYAYPHIRTPTSTRVY